MKEFAEASTQVSVAHAEVWQLVSAAVVELVPYLHACSWSTRCERKGREVKAVK